ncbi:MAG: signal peptide peptidase SppA [Candidatus Pacearchaeota archaeon]
MKKRFNIPRPKTEVLFEIEKHKKHKRTLLVFLIILVVTVTFLLAILLKPTSLHNVALIHIDGVLLSGEQEFTTGASFSDTIIRDIEDATKNKNIKAIIFEINSPGGSAVAAQEIGDTIKKAREKVLTVALIRETGASGAYWVASSCDYIIASPMSITGSIGVIASYLEYSGLLERFNITYERLVSGKYKDIGSPYKELTEDERRLLQNILDQVYKSFVSEIKANRNLSQEQAESIADGMFYLGAQAKELGLIDALGSKKDAIKYIEEKKGIKASIREYKQSYSLFPFSSMSLTAYWVGKGIGSSLVKHSLENFKIIT